MLVAVLALTSAARAQSEQEPNPDAEQSKAEEPAADEPKIREAIIEETSRGEAVSETAAPGWPYPKAIASRPLTRNKYMIRGTFSVVVKRGFVQ